MFIAVECYKFFLQNWHSEIKSLHTLRYAELQNLHDLLRRSASLQRVLDMKACAGRIHLRT